jgi:RNA polymerase sigma factor (TIGR02999 family)
MSEGPDATPPQNADLAGAYEKLRRIGQKLISGERPGHTLSATDVVHEAMAKMLSAGWTPPNADEAGQALVQFVRHAARAMTEVLIDHARSRGAVKRGGGRAKVRLDQLDDVEATMDRDKDFDWEALDRALAKLDEIDPRRSTVVTLRFFGGLDNRQIARQIGVDERTVGRDWATARAWLKDALERE